MRRVVTVAQSHNCSAAGAGGCGRVCTSRPLVGMWRLRGAGRAPLRLHGGAPRGPLQLGRAAVCTHDLGRAHYSPHGLASRCVLSCRYALWHPARQRINGTSQGRTSGLCASGQSRVSLGGLLYRREASRPTGRRAAGRQRAGKRGAEYNSAGLPKQKLRRAARARAQNARINKQRRGEKQNTAKSKTLLSKGVKNCPDQYSERKSREEPSK